MGSLSPARQAARPDPATAHVERAAAAAPAAATVAAAPTAAPARAPVAPAAAAAPPAPAALAPSDVRRALRTSMLEGAVATVHISITGVIGGSVFLTGFAMLLGANSFQLGLLGALPFIGQLTGFLGAYLEERVGNRRSLVLYGALGGRLIWALLLALPFLSFLGGAQLAVFFAALALSYALNGIAGNAWLSWMSDLVPPRERGSYFGVRNTVAAIAAMATTFLAGAGLDAMRAQGLEAGGYAMVFGVAVLAAFGSAALVARQAEPPVQRRAHVSLREMLGAPLADRPFRAFVAANMGWAFVTGVATPFFNAYGLTTLQLSFATLGLTAVVTGAVSLVFGPLVGRLQDKLGYRRVLVACVAGSVLLPWGWVLSTPTNIWPLWLTAIFSGVFWPGLTQGLANVMMERAPAEHRGAAIATFGAFGGLGTLAAGLVGGLIATAVAGSQIAIGPLSIAGLAFLFVLTSLGRGVMALVFWRTL
ncbi:MAG TPA: MFS transporter [Chloroflexaceae bacterium]|nr:MFS transporter [Chloroflexaceae bacterium]